MRPSFSRDRSEISALERTIARGGSFFLLGHENPDGDCLGSMAGLYNLLSGRGKDVTMAVYEEIPRQFQLAADSMEEEPGLYSGAADLSSFDAVIALDCSDRKRLGPASGAVADLDPEETALINIDHHEDNTHFGGINLVVEEAAATGEIIFDLARNWNWTIPLNSARPLALAMLADTGFFRYSNTDRDVMKKVMELMDIGVDIYQINRDLYGRKDPRILKLTGRALSSLELAAEGKIAYMVLRNEDYTRTGTGPQDREGIVNYARDVEDVEAGLLFSEEDSGVKVSFRSNSYLSVNSIAAEFGGGGHPRAAGCRLEMEIEEAVEKVLAEVKKNV